MRFRKATAFNVARYILKKQGPMSMVRLQKLVYYCQAWSLAWDDEPIFSEPIYALDGGPSILELYARIDDTFLIDANDFSKLRFKVRGLTKNHIETIDAVLEAYGDKSPQWLCDQTRQEPPWKEARGGYEITLESMKDYYASLE